MSSDEDIPRSNGAVLNISQVIKAVISSTAEAWLGVLLINNKIAVLIPHDYIVSQLPQVL